LNVDKKDSYVKVLNSELVYTGIKSKILEEIIGIKHAQGLSANALLRHSIFVLHLR